MRWDSLAKSLWLTATLLGWAISTRGAEPAPEISKETRFREPVALAFSRDGSRLVVANRRSGSLSVIDPRAGRVVAEYGVGKGPSDVVSVGDGRHWLALDRAGDTLVVCSLIDDVIRVESRLGVSADPVSVRLRDDGREAVVASLATHRLSVLAIDPASPTAPFEVRLIRSVRLPFAPRCVAYVEKGRSVVVADAYAGRLAVVDGATGEVRSRREFPAQNIRGMTISSDGSTLILTHQVLNPAARSDFEGVHWGRMISNHLRMFPLDSVLNARDDHQLLEGCRVFDLGSFGNAGGDPAGVAVDPSGGVAVALSGTSEVTVGPYSTDLRQRVSVGKRPLAVAFRPDGEAVYSADAFDDTVTAIDLPVGLWRGSISLGPRPALDAVARGERLFFNARLSHDGWMSCHTCHADGQTNGGRADTLGDGSYGAPKRVPSLLGVGATGPWAWNGSIQRLEDQVRKSIESTMQGNPPTDAQVADLTAFLRVLPSPTPARHVLRDPEAVERGRSLFQARKCDTCHTPPTYTSAKVVDVGLADEHGRKAFNPPSLLGIGDRTPLLHDGRAATLREVFTRHGHPRDARWDDAEVQDLVAFLQSL